MEDARELGNWLPGELTSLYGMERETWGTERVARVMWKLNKARRGKPKLEVEILGLSVYNAFTAPGHHLYISRRLLERCANDAEVAMVLAHEAAHHDLGHLDAFGGWVKSVPRIMGARLFAAAFRRLARRVHRHEAEYAADLRGLELCMKAKFAPKECLQFFEILRMDAIDVGDFDAAYGVDDEIDLAQGLLDGIFLRARALAGKLTRGSHPSIAERKERLLQWLDRE